VSVVAITAAAAETGTLTADEREVLLALAAPQQF
jgi:hypothetical protein